MRIAMQKPMKTIQRFLWLCILACMVATTDQPLYAQASAAYTKQMQQWYKGREDYLRSPAGWLNLAGLYWLQPGNNSFGSDSSNTLVFKHAQMPAWAGTFIVQDGKVSWVSAPGTRITVKDSLVEDLLVFSKEQSPMVLATGALRWNIILREDRIGLRLRDLASPTVTGFSGIARFPLNEKWRIRARLVQSPNLGIRMANVIGQSYLVSSPGKLHFVIDGKKYALDAMTEDDQLFLVFGDATSGKDTYAAGRFLYAPLPDANGETILDFNQAINPPCAFSTYATCPLPPPQNILPIAIRAGEKDYEDSKNKKQETP